MPTARRPIRRAPTRTRRTPEEARRLILDAAERRLREGGPEAIRLQEIARDVGISHPAILHHFESREGLTRALAQRATQSLADELFRVLREKPASEASTQEIIENLFAAFADSGQARLVAWRELSFAPSERGNEARDMIQRVTDIMHERRREHARNQGHPLPSREDSLFLVRLVTTALLGDTFVARLFREDDPAAARADRRFRKWLASLLFEHVGGT